MSFHSDVFSNMGVAMLASCLSLPGFAIADESAEAPKGENASNPLAAADNTDLRWQYFDLDHGSRQDYFDWENDQVPASVELQLGKSFSPSFGAYIDGLVGLGGDKPYDLGEGIGVRFNY